MRRRRVLAQFLQSEVEHFHHAFFRDHDVAGLDVPMRHAGFVRRGKGGGDLGGVAKRFRGSQAIAEDHGVERLSLDVFHDDIVGTDVRMVESTGSACFLREASFTHGIGGVLHGQ